MNLLTKKKRLIIEQILKTKLVNWLKKKFKTKLFRKHFYKIDKVKHLVL